MGRAGARGLRHRRPVYVSVHGLYPGGATPPAKSTQPLVSDAPSPVTRLLAAARAGDDGALEQAFALAYDELAALAHRQRRRWTGHATLDTVALVNEAYLKLVGPAPEVEGRTHFLALAAKAMRQILSNYARDQNALKRGGDAVRVTLDGLDAAEAAPSLVDLDDALVRLERVDARLAAVVECRFFGGLTVAETAEALGVSARTVKRDWALAQAWLHRALAPSHA